MREGWTYKKLGEVCEILDSLRKPVSKKDRAKGIYPYYGASGIQDYVDSYLFDERFLIVGEDGAKWGASDKTAYIIEGKSWVNNHAHILRVSEEVNDRLIEYYLTFKDLSEYITGAIVPKLTQANLIKIPIPVPPLTEQERIVSELDLLSSIIKKKKAQLQEYDQLAQSIFYDMFGDPVTNDKGWEVKKLGEVCTKITDGSHNPPVGVEHSDFLMLSSKNVTNQGFTFDDPRYLTKEQFDAEHKRTNVKKGDVFLVIVGAGVGKSCIYNKNYPITLQRSVAVLSPLYGVLNSLYLNWFIVASHNVICNEAKGAAQKGIYLNQLSKVNISLPPLSLQQQFAEKIEAIEKQKEQIKQSITEVETLFNSRMDYYFN